MPSPANSIPAAEVHTAILFFVGAFSFVIDAGVIEEIRGLGGIERISWPRPQAGLDKVTHLLHRGKRTAFIVDGGTYFRVPDAHPARILLLRGIDVGLMVDGVDRMVEYGSMFRLPQAFTGEECSWYLGLTFLQKKVIPVVHPGAFVTRAELSILRDASQHRQLEASSPSSRL
jgi:hypothetical protein